MSETIVVNVNGQSTAWASTDGKAGAFAGPLRNAARDHALAGPLVELSPGNPRPLTMSPPSARLPPLSCQPARHRRGS